MIKSDFVFPTGHGSIKSWKNQPDSMRWQRDNKAAEILYDRNSQSPNFSRSPPPLPWMRNTMWLSSGRVSRNAFSLAFSPSMVSRYVYCSFFSSSLLFSSLPIPSFFYFSNLYIYLILHCRRDLFRSRAPFVIFLIWFLCTI